MVGPKPRFNTDVRLYPEAAESQRLVFEIAPTHDVRWVQCHRCRRRFWYALLEATPQEERWEWATRLRAELLAKPCPDHPTSVER
jgi:hypothetical protein